MLSKRRHWARLALRQRLASEPKCRIFINPAGRTCCRKRRRNSTAVRVMTFFLAVAVVSPSETDLAVGHGNELGLGDGDTVGV